MRRGRKSTPVASAGLVGRRLRRLGPVLLLLILTGCVPETAPAFDNDPLVGGRPLPRNGAAPTGTAAAPRASGGLLPPPASSGATSPAALAVGSSSPTDAGSLRIGQPSANSGSPSGLVASAPRDGDPWRGSSPSGVILKQPEPLNDPRVRPIAEIAPPTAGGAGPSAGPDTYDQLQNMLTQRAVLFQSLQGPDEHGLWRFSCGVPSRDKPGANHIIELSAPGDHGLAAMRAVIDQIDREQQQR